MGAFKVSLEKGKLQMLLYKTCWLGELLSEIKLIRKGMVPDAFWFQVFREKKYTLNFNKFLGLCLFRYNFYFSCSPLNSDIKRCKL